MTTGERDRFENPKGTLLEFCARACVSPTFENLSASGRAGARILMTLEGENLDSGVHWALDRTRAEQRAAAVVLDALAEDHDGVSWVDEDDGVELRSANAKGNLLERAARGRLIVHFDTLPIISRAHGLGFEATAHVVLDEKALWSATYQAATAIVAEHAAARSLAPRLTAALDARSKPAVPVVMSAPAGAAVNARAVLNEMAQKKHLLEVGFVVERIEGPPHARMFVVAGFAVRSDGSGVEARGAKALTKRDAEKLAAARLLEEVETGSRLRSTLTEITAEGRRRR